jgi:hypothetical protein
MIDSDFVGGGLVKCGEGSRGDGPIKINRSKCCDVFRTCQTLHSRNANDVATPYLWTSSEDASPFNFVRGQQQSQEKTTLRSCKQIDTHAMMKAIGP